MCQELVQDQQMGLSPEKITIEEEAKVITKILSIAAGLSLSFTSVAFGADMIPTKFTVRIENITNPDAFTASNGVKWSLGFSPGVAVVHTENAPIFSAGKKDRGKGLEAQSEDGDPSMLAKSLENGKGIKSVAVFNTLVGVSAPGPITPGGAYEFTVSGVPGDRLSITTMMGQSNDWFMHRPSLASSSLRTATQSAAISLSK
jgi:hypothetical protein